MPTPKPGDCLYVEELDSIGVFTGIIGRDQDRLLVTFAGNPMIDRQFVISGGNKGRLIPKNKTVHVGKYELSFYVRDHDEKETRIVDLFKLTKPLEQL